MTHRQFAAQLDRPLIESAIRDAERKTSGEICVIVHHEPVADAVAVAQREFLRRGLQKTRHRNAVLILIAPLARKFAVVGDEAVHRLCGDAFWQKMTAAMATEFKAGRFTAGLVRGIGQAGALLAQHFPPAADDRNELPDQVIDE